MIKPETIEKREYQFSIAMKALDVNSQVILPTGLRKTAVALLTAISRVRNEGCARRTFPTLSPSPSGAG